MQALQQPANICLKVLPLVARGTRSKRQMKGYILIGIKKVNQLQQDVQQYKNYWTAG